MKIETVTITISGLERDYVFYHTSDCHLAYALPEEGEQAAQKAEEQNKVWSYTGLQPADAVQQVLAIAQEDQADGLFLCGDLMDYLSKGTLKAVRDALQSTKTPKFYACGNHERIGAEMPDSRDFYSDFTDLMPGSPGFWTYDFGAFVIVGMDDGDKQMREEQLRLLEEQFAKQKPILLLIHIPIITETVAEAVRQKWGPDGPDYFLLGQEKDTELSRRFCRMLADPAAPIKAVFAGHIHLPHAGEIIQGRIQYVSGPAFEGTIRKYILKAE